MIPKDPVILLSYINTQLRDHYSTIDALSDGLDLDAAAMEDICSKLGNIGYNYDPEKNQFI